jgi:hypothetical protein
MVLAASLMLLFALAFSDLGADSDRYRVVELEDVGTIAGFVAFQGEVPPPKRLLITKDIEVCGSGYRERWEVLTGDGGGLRNVAVFIEDVAEGKPWPEDLERYVVDQRECSFQPHVQVMRRGAEFDIVNSDGILHNIHGYEFIGRARRSMFNISQPEKGAIPQKLDARRGIKVGLECDSHDFMQGWIYAVDNPYATVVDSTGRFRIGEVPAGSHKVTLWHPRLGMQTQDVSVAAGETAELQVVYSEE